MNDEVFKSEEEFVGFLNFLDRKCMSSAHEVILGIQAKLKFAYNCLESNIGMIDVFRYQYEENWNSKNPYSCQIGQGMFLYNDREVIVNDRCDSGWKYCLPNSKAEIYEDVTDIPTLTMLIDVLKESKDLTGNFIWKGPYNK